MSLLSITRLSRLVREFRKDARGNVAIIFALVSIPLVALVGAAVDYTRASSARTALQTALDSAALMISKDAATMTAAQITTRARQYVDSLYVTTDAPIQSFSATYTPNTGSGATILLDAGGNIPTYFMRVMGSNFNTLPITSSSTTTWGSTRTRVALVLDNTGSMQDNGKMTALKTAAAGPNGLIQQLSTFNSIDGDVYISIVPFSKDVNAGSASYSADWINWADWLNPPTAQQPNNKSVQPPKLPMNWHAVGPGAKCPFTNSNGGFTCTTGPSNGASSTSTIPSSGTYSGYICPSIDNNTAAYYNGCWSSEQKSTSIDVFCTGSSSCSCPTTSSGSAVPGCTCSGNGNSKSCSGYTYIHNWTQPGPNDTSHNLNQPRVSAYVGFKNRKWTSTTYSDSSLQVKNDWQNASTNSISTWNGCITDRDQSYDTTNTPYVVNDGTMMGDGTLSTRFYAEQSIYCPPATITAMSNKWSDLKSQINSMTPNGNTNQAVGLSWGWQTLNTSNNPYKAPAKDPNWVYQDYIVILSDGMNTQNRWTTSQSAIDTRQQTLCNNIKDPAQNGGNKITIFAIQVNINNRDPESQVLKNCAKSPTPPYFQTINQSGQTADAFNSILAQIAKLRISK
jgi:Flp pilus assembly protein TadG